MLISGWNVMLLGVAIYTGLGCFEAATSPFIRFSKVDWFQPTKDEVTWFMSSFTIFLVVLIATYYFNPLSKLSARTLNKFPRQSVPMYFWVLGVCALVVILMPLTSNSVFLGRVMLNLSHKAVVFATAFSFMLWMRQRSNPAWLALFIFTFLSALLLAVLAGPTRRLFLSVFLGPVVFVYMAYMRSWKPTRALAAIGVAAAVLLSVGFMYNTVRRFNTDPFKERTAVTAIKEVKNIDKSWIRALTQDTYRMMAQSNVQYSLFTQRMVESGRLEAKPLNTLAFLASYPIPRRLWLEKPSVIGVTITHDVVNAQRTNWGVNVVGHTAYEGGLWVAALYGFLASVGLRFIDDPLLRQPTNPFLVAMFTAAAPHILGWTRGDLGVMTIETAECYLFAIILAISARLFFGTETTSQTSFAVASRARAFRQSFAP
jgi:hypothetical protein